MAVIGTLIPFLLMVSALRHLPATHVAVAVIQVAGGAIVLTAIAWLQPTARRALRPI